MAYQILTDIQTKYIRFGILILVGALVAGCAIAPRPSVEIYIAPVEGHANAKVNAETGAVTVEQKGVAVTLEPLDEVEIFALTDNPRLNPYLFVRGNGAVEPIYTVFEVTVHNLDTPRVLADDAAVLIDATGAQYGNLPYDYFEALYDNLEAPQQTPFATTPYPDYHPIFHRYYPYYQTYLDVEALEVGRNVVKASLFTSGKLFPGAKRRGLLIFDRLNIDATALKIVLPEIRIVRSNGKQDKLMFKFDFRQVVAEK